MKKTYTQKSVSSRGNFVKSFLALTFICLMLFTGNNSWGQVSNYSFSQSSGTYTEITGGTVSASGDALDDDRPSVTLPTAFVFNGTSITTVGFSGNGYLIMGNTTTHGVSTPLTSTATSSGVISALGIDLVSTSTTSEQRWQVVGNEIVFQWKKFKRYNNPALTGEEFSFQIRLNTATGAIKMVYDGSSVINAITTKNPQVGLRGSANTDYNARNLTATVPSATPSWSNTAAGTSNGATVLLTSTAPASFPASGQTYTWAPPTCFSPSAITASAITPTTTTISWTAPGTAPASGYEYEIRTSGAAGSGATGLFTSNTTAAGITTANLTGLTSGTTYSIYVRSNCGSGDFSPWTSAVTFVPSCSSIPTAVTSSAVTTATATISWTESTPASTNGYEYEIRTSGAAGSGATGLFTSNTTAAGVATANITGLASSTTYNVYVRGNCGSGNFSTWTAIYTFTTTCSATNVPYTQDFESVTVPALPSCTSVQNAGTGNNWNTASDVQFGFTGKYLRYRWNSSAPANTWFYTRAINLTAGTSYRISYDYGGTNSTSYPENLKVAYGTADNAAGMTIPLADHPSIITNKVSNSIDFTPGVSGVYYFGFNAYSATNLFYLHVDNIKVDLSPTCLEVGNPVVSAITPTTATITWTASASLPSGGYEYEIRTSGAAGSGATGLFFAGTTTAGITTANLTSLVTGTTYSIYVRANCGSGDFSSWTPAVTFTPTCVLPTAVVISATTPATATVSWTASTSSPSSGYEYEIRTSGAAGSGATGLFLASTTAAGITTANIIGLTDATTYNVFVRSSCGSGSFSAWTSSSSFTTGCKIPTTPVVSAVTTATATITWTNPTGFPANGYEYEIRTSGAAGSGATGLFLSNTTASNVLTADLIGLSAATTYSVYVRAVCGTTSFSGWTSAGTFTTLCDVEAAPTAVQPFTNATGTFPAICWTEATGTLAAASTLTVINSEWLASTSFANTGSNKGIKTNLYSTGNEWIISQAIDLGTTTDFRLRYDMAVTSYDGTVVQPTLGSHKVHVVISTDGGTTWSDANVLKTYTGVGTYSATGQSEIISLAAYTGVVKIAFVAVTTSNIPDIDFHLDNFIVDEIPACPDPTALTALATSATTGTISWTATAPAPTDGYEYEVRTSGAAGSGVTGLTTSGTTASAVVTKNITGLTANTTYSVYVRANCGSGSFSPWTNAVTLFTGYCTPAPSSVDGTGITNVAIGTINNAGPLEPNNYGDYSAMSTDIVLGVTDTVRITYTTGYTYGTKVWVDLNNDLDFTDAGELLFSGLSGAADPTTYKAPITIPYGTSIGAHLMRIGGTDNDAGPSGPCYTGTYGSFEDYTLNVVCPTVVAAPTAPVSAVICANATADLSITGITNANLTWYDAATAGTIVNNDATFTTGTLATTTSYWVEQSFTGCAVVSPRVEVTATVSPVNVALTAINNTCNGYATGSFALGTVSCGTAPFEYSVNGGAFGPIPTNLVAGTYSIIVRDDAADLSEAISLVITQPATVVPLPTTANANACVDATSKIVTATPAMIAGAPVVVSFDLAAQPAQVFAAPGSIISTSTMPALPAGAVITSVVLSMPNVEALPGTWEYDVRLGLSGAIENTAISASLVEDAGVFDYVRTIPNNAVTAAGGTVNLLYYNYFNDLDGDPEALFPIGTGVATVTINYNVPATVTWWTDATGGTQLGSALTLETVGTSVLASPAAVGAYTFYAQTETGTCSSVTRAPLVVTVHANPVPTITSPSTAYCAGSTVQLTSSAAASYVWSTTAITNSIAVGTVGSYTVTVTDANGCVGTSAPLAITENALPTPTISAGGALTFCEGDDVELTASATTGIVWSTTETSASITVDEAGSYTVSETDANGCVGTSAATVVVVNALPVPTITADGPLGICPDGDVVLTASATTGIVWSTTETSASITVDEAGSFTVTQTDVNGCVGTSAATVVTVNTLPTVNAGADQTVCAGTAVTLAGSGAVDYDWNNNVTNNTPFAATATTTYTVTGTDANGCTNTDNVTVTVNAVPVATVAISNDVTIVATPAGQTYQWINCAGNTHIAGATNATFTATVNGSYKVIITNASGCKDTSACINVTKVGLEEMNADLGISLYPNPTNGDVYVTMTSTEAADITVYDAQGKVVSVMSNVQNGAVIDLKNVEMGIYMIKVANPIGSNIFRIVKN